MSTAQDRAYWRSRHREATPMTHPDYGTPTWAAMIEARRLPCTIHPRGCTGIVSERVAPPFSGYVDKPCEGTPYCWCGELCTEAGRQHASCWARRYAMVWAVRGLQLYFAPVNEAWLRKRFRPGADTVTRYGPVGAGEVKRGIRADIWRALG